ncbi:MAG: sugar transferase [Candidatus Delongbacteria bacterium]|nr:sugar transferase [Candidatus Delongbacteria bacterium]
MAVHQSDLSNAAPQVVPLPSGWYFHWGKRTLDSLLVLLTLPLWLPLLCLLGLVVLLDSGRPVLYSQARMGHQGRRFILFKLRTMTAGVSAPPGALFEGWTYHADPRITRCGRFLRRFRLDELPQLFNVLRGEMSLVGPRPEPWEIARALSAQIPGYSRRHLVRPGLTGLCQLSPRYLEFGTIDQSRRKAELDLVYVDTLSLATDLKLLCRTPLAMLRLGGVS